MTDDTHIWQCPDCPKKNSLAVWKCICGHVRKRPERGEVGGKDRRFCSFISASGRQCPLPGDVSDRIGSDSHYCSGHLKDRSGPLAEQIFEDNVANYQQIMARLKGSDLLTWWNSDEAKAQRAAAVKAPPVDEEAEKERRRLEAEQIAERAAIQDEAGVPQPLVEHVPEEYRDEPF